jgi:hypothetical protein
MYLYPSGHDIHELTQDEINLKVARHSSCSQCECSGLHPGDDDVVVAVEEHDPSSEHSLLDHCACGHTVIDHGNDPSIPQSEQYRRAKVAIRLDELLQVRFRDVMSLASSTRAP